MNKMDFNLIQKYKKELDNIQNLNNEYYEKLNKMKGILRQENEEINKIKDGHEEEFRILNKKILLTHYEMSEISNEYDILIYIIDNQVEKFRFKNIDEQIVEMRNKKNIGILKILNEKLKILNEKLSDILNDHLNIVKEIKNLIIEESE